MGRVSERAASAHYEDVFAVADRTMSPCFREHSATGGILAVLKHTPWLTFARGGPGNPTSHEAMSSKWASISLSQRAPPFTSSALSAPIPVFSRLSQRSSKRSPDLLCSNEVRGHMLCRLSRSGRTRDYPSKSRAKCDRTCHPCLHATIDHFSHVILTDQY